jgi:hypothetical protein
MRYSPGTARSVTCVTLLVQLEVHNHVVTQHKSTPTIVSQTTLWHSLWTAWDHTVTVL